MANVLQTLAAHVEENKVFYERALLSRLLPNLVFHKYIQQQSLPQNEGDTINFRRFESLPDATTPLTEGAPGDGNELTVTLITATLAQYGSYVRLTDKMMKVGIDKCLSESIALLGEQAAKTINALDGAAFGAGTNVHYVGATPGRSNITATDVITGDAIAKVVRTLRAADAQPIEGDYFIGVIHPNVAYDLRNDALWEDVSKYNGGAEIMKGEVGKLHGVRFIESTTVPIVTVSKTEGEGASAVTTNINVYSTIIMGKDCAGGIDLESQGAGKPTIIVKDLGSAGTADPLNQVASAGWKCMYESVILQQAALCRIETAATA